MKQQSQNLTIQMDQQLSQPNAMLQKIAATSAQNPNAVIVYFVKHKAASSSLAKPKQPLMMFKRDMRVQQIFYALYLQIEVKGMTFYVLKSEDNNRASYMPLKPGKTIGSIYDQFGKKHYLIIIYNKGTINRWKISETQQRILRLLIIFAMIWITANVYPIINDYFNPNQSLYKTNTLYPNEEG